MWFRRKRKAKDEEAVRALREQVFRVEPQELGLTPTTARPHVWGVLMETGYPEAVVTLVAIADGTTSLYFSNGGGILGAGEHESVRAASEMLLEVAEAHLGSFSAAATPKIPQVGRVRFHVRTFAGTLTAEAGEEDLGEDRHVLSPVFYAAHEVIGAIRECSPEL